MPDTMSRPGPRSRMAMAMNQFCERNSVSPRRPPCRENVPKATPSKATCHAPPGVDMCWCTSGVSPAAIDRVVSRRSTAASACLGIMPSLRRLSLFPLQVPRHETQPDASAPIPPRFGLLSRHLADPRSIFLSSPDWDAKLPELKRRYQQAQPYPHIVLEGLFDEATVREALD